MKARLEPSLPNLKLVRQALNPVSGLDTTMHGTQGLPEGRKRLQNDLNVAENHTGL